MIPSTRPNRWRWHDLLTQRAPRHVPHRDREGAQPEGGDRGEDLRREPGQEHPEGRHEVRGKHDRAATEPPHERRRHDRADQRPDADPRRDEADCRRCDLHLVEEEEDERRLSEREGGADDAREDDHRTQIPSVPQIRDGLASGDLGRREGRGHRFGNGRARVDVGRRGIRNPRLLTKRPRGRERQQDRQDDRHDVAEPAQPQRQRQRDGEQDARDRGGDEVVDRDLRGLDPAVGAIELRTADNSGQHGVGGVVEERLTEAEDQGAGEQRPDVDVTGHREHREPQRDRTADGVGDRHDDAPIESVDQHPGGQPEHEPGHEREGADHRDRERILRERGRDERHGRAAQSVGEIAERGGGPQLAEVATQRIALARTSRLIGHGGGRRAHRGRRPSAPNA